MTHNPDELIAAARAEHEPGATWCLFGVSRIKRQLHARKNSYFLVFVAR